mgnify:CR=1 FL=1
MADLSEADLYRADLYGANLCETDAMHAKFIGKTESPKKLKPEQVDDFLSMLGFEIEK